MESVFREVRDSPAGRAFPRERVSPCGPKPSTQISGSPRRPPSHDPEDLPVPVLFALLFFVLAAGLVAG